MGRHADAQTTRWAIFERLLSAPHLTAYLKQLDDDLDEEEQALHLALRYPDVVQALDFLRTWPDRVRAARLVIDRVDEVDGTCYWALTPAAQELSDRSPLAATLLLRAMIDFTLAGARSSRYKHAARHLAEWSRLASAIEDFRDFESYADYETPIRYQQRRKTKFQRLLHPR